MKESLAGYIRERSLRYYIETYGCQMNEHDSEKIAGILEELGYMPAARQEDADFLLFNTCCVRENAERKIFGNVGALRQLVARRKGMVVAVCGCMMQQEEAARKLARMFPFVSIIFGTSNMAELPAMLYGVLIGGRRTVAVRPAGGAIVEDVPVRRSRPPVASVSIMQGCNNFCSYCIVPYVRGPERSRAEADILAEIQALEPAYKEVLLLGQNVNSYGGGGADFSRLLQRIARETDIQRIRFMTPHPKDVSAALIETIAQESKVCNAIHLPVQSGSSRILEQMNRKYTQEDYLALVARIREACPGITLTTDIIVGFPGETDADFEDTMELVEKVRYDAAFTFVYSPRTGTKAAAMAGQISEETKRARIMRLVERQNEITYAQHKARVGSVERVLVEGLSRRDSGEVCGRTDGGRMVNLAGGASMIGNFYDVEITESKRSTLKGRVMDGSLQN